MSEQYHFDFKDWEAAFAMYYRKRLGEEIVDNERGDFLGRRKGNPNIQLVVSSGDSGSGYWIEENATSGPNTRVYRSVEAVRVLEGCVRKSLADNLREPAPRPKRPHYGEVLRIIEGATRGDRQKVLNYSNFLADKVEEDGDKVTADRIRKVAAGNAGLIIKPAEESL
jgi:hypothetical protein